MAERTKCVVRFYCGIGQLTERQMLLEVVDAEALLRDERFHRCEQSQCREPRIVTVEVYRDGALLAWAGEERAAEAPMVVQVYTGVGT